MNGKKYAGRGLQARTNTAARNVLLEFNIFIKEEM